MSLTLRRLGFLLLMATMLAAGLSTGTRFYYLVFYALLAMLLLGLVSVMWTLLTVKVTLKGLRSRVNRGERLPAVFTLRHGCPLPVSGIEVRLCVPSSLSPTQAVSVACPPFVTRTFRQVIPCPHRGVYRAGVDRVRVTDAFGLLCLGRGSGAKPMTLEVLPRAHEAQPLSLSGAAPCGERWAPISTAPADS